VAGLGGEGGKLQGRISLSLQEDNAASDGNDGGGGASLKGAGGDNVNCKGRFLAQGRGCAVRWVWY
jgi:hypothetical protein